MARKRWKLRFTPTLHERSATSQLDAYRVVERYRQWRAEGRVRVDSVSVYVSEDKGPWQLFERVKL